MWLEIPLSRLLVWVYMQMTALCKWQSLHTTSVTACAGGGKQCEYPPECDKRTWWQSMFDLDDFPEKDRKAYLARLFAIADKVGGRQGRILPIVTV